MYLPILGLNLRGEPSRTASESPVCCGHGEEEEDVSRPASGSFSPSTSSRAGSEMDQISAAPSGRGDRCTQNTASGSGPSERSDSCVAMTTDSLLSRGRGPGVGTPETRPPPTREQVSVDLKPYIFSDTQEPSSLGSRGTPLRQDVATSVPAICALGERVGHTTLGLHSAEPQDHRAAGEALTQSPPDREAIAAAVSPSVLPGKPSCGQRRSGLLLLGSTGKTHLEMPAPGSASSYQEEGEHKTFFPTGGQCGGGEMVVPCPPLGNESGKCQVSGLTSLKECVVPSKPGQPRESPEAPSKTVKRRGLEGLRKQTRVEVSDTSSDDEDRLVIEM
uniref:zinc finger protein 831 n=1 Tax=Panthera onca TaxID=9690 RepID=UPI0029532D89|nr:zinc finger protein 831 [Panthera onca]